MNGFLPDGGTAVAEGKLRLPQVMMLTELTVSGQPLIEIQPGRTMIGVEIWQHWFSFLVPLTPDQVVEHFETEVLLIITDFTIGPPQMSATTGERFRDVLCELKR